MLKFIIVGKDPKEIRHVEKLLNQVVKEDKKVLKFTNPKSELRQEIKSKEMQKVYILDIELDSNISGITIAKQIREYDLDSEIIFITNHEKMFEIAHRSVYKVFDFIEKFHNFDSRLKKDIKKILYKTKGPKTFSYKTNSAIINIYYDSILYIYRETEERKLVIVTENNKYKVNLCIKEISELLDKRFVKTNRSCIANNTRIEEMNYKNGYFRLDTGEIVYMLSKKFKKAIEQC